MFFKILLLKPKLVSTFNFRCFNLFLYKVYVYLNSNILQEIVTPDVLYEEVVEVDCRVINLNCEKCDLSTSIWNDKPIVRGVTGEDILILKEIEEAALKNDLTLLKAKGINSIAVALMHSYT